MPPDMQRTQHERCKAHACIKGVRAVACMSGRKNKHAQRMPAHVSAAAARETRKMQDTTVHNTCMRSCALVTWPQHAEHAPAHAVPENKSETDFNANSREHIKYVDQRPRDPGTESSRDKETKGPETTRPEARSQIS